MLQEIIKYAQKELHDSEPGFTTRYIRWMIQISSEGKLINIIPLGPDDKGEIYTKCPEMHNMNAGGRAHFLVETAQTVTLFFKANEEKKKIDGTQEKHLYFKKMIEEVSKSNDKILPLKLFFDDTNQVQILREKLTEIKVKPNDWIRWSLAGTDPLQEELVLNWWRNWRQTDKTKGKDTEITSKTSKKNSFEGMVCFLTGKVENPIETQPKVTGLSGIGGLPTGDVMAGFDKDAFCSFGLKKASNAAMNEKSAREYIDGINDLIKRHSRKIANSLIVHWFKEKVNPEDDPLAFLYEPPEITETASQNSAKKILESIKNGHRAVAANNTFYAITLSGASGRVMVREWMEGSFEDIVAKITKWFSDIEIVSRDGKHIAHDPKFMAVCGAVVRDLKELPTPTAVTLFNVAIKSLPIPLTFVAQALSRFRSDLIEDKPFNHARMGLIKAYFIRKDGGKNMSVFLNKEHPEAAYQCGRLLAVLASLQQSALGDVGAGLVQRYYVAASQTPGLTIGRLISNAKNHLNKLDGGLAHWYEDHISEIMSHINEKIPATLDLEKQSLFALGYYQQIAANRAGTKNNNSKDGANNE